VYVDADYIVPNQYLELIYNQFIHNNNLDIIAGAYSFIDGSRFLHDLTKNGVIFGMYYQLIRLIFGFQYLTGGNFAIRKNAYLQVGGFREHYTSVMEGDDIEFSMRLAKAGFKSIFDRRITSFTSMRRIKKYNFKDQFMRQYWFFYHVLSYRLTSMQYPSLKAIKA
jgi:GT2 family glycosyltransferase